MKSDWLLKYSLPEVPEDNCYIALFRGVEMRRNSAGDSSTFQKCMN